MSRRKGVPCGCDADPCGCSPKNHCVKKINGIPSDPNGDFTVNAGTGIGIIGGDNAITIVNTSDPDTFVEGKNIEFTPSGDDLEIGVVDDPVIDGTLTVNGDIIQNGAAYETHAEKVYTTNDYIVMREGAVGGLAVGDYSGFQVEKYDGTNDGRLVMDRDGVARVGDVGDEQPLLTRDESADLTDGAILAWDAADQKAKTDLGTIGSDTKPVKIVNGVATAVTNDLQVKMGTVTANNSVSLTSNTANFAIVSVTAPIKGRAIINIRGGFVNNTTGYRLVGYSKNNPSNVSEWLLNTNANGDYMYYSTHVIVDVNAGDVIYGCGYQTSGSTLNCSMGITMMIFPN